MPNKPNMPESVHGEFVEAWICPYCRRMVNVFTMDTWTPNLMCYCLDSYGPIVILEKLVLASPIKKVKK